MMSRKTKQSDEKAVELVKDVESLRRENPTLCKNYQDFLSSYEDYRRKEREYTKNTSGTPRRTSNWACNG